MAEPMWSFGELAEHKKVSLDALRSRAKTERCKASNPKPEPIMFQDSLSANGDRRKLFVRRKAYQTKRYLRSELLAWFDAEEAHKPFKRLA